MVGSMAQSRFTQASLLEASRFHMRQRLRCFGFGSCPPSLHSSSRPGHLPQLIEVAFRSNGATVWEFLDNIVGDVEDAGALGGVLRQTTTTEATELGGSHGNLALRMLGKIYSSESRGPSGLAQSRHRGF